ncbi:helix-turn-helix transcriptional regulator [Dyadobacter sp. 676]|uniref:Helix-turn-helix transcriptional regulator n=1 Tax=Dyadobacter sp. 676 TaxID=3088362 RepID=A0AAU8FH99_9BACT
MKNEHCYLVGTMSTAIETSISPHSHLAGIRFRPAGFAAFYEYDSLHEYTDRTVEFDNKLAPDLRGTRKGLRNGLKYYLDEFFLRKLPERQPQLTPVITEIESRNGLVDVPVLARNHCVSVRQLQRAFKMHIGLSPKEFLNVIRFRYALRLIKNNAMPTLLDIALEAGYYDHAHLSNEIRRHAGVAPSLL